MRLSALNLISYKSNYSVNSVNNNTQQINNNQQIQQKPVENTSKSNYKKIGLVLTGLVLLGIGIYKGKSLLNGVKDVATQSEPRKPYVKPEINIKPKKENVEQTSEMASEVVNAEVVHVPPKPKNSTSKQHKSKDIIVIDEKGNILETKTNRENSSQRTNPFDFEQKTSNGSAFDRTMEVVDDVTDAIILDDLLFHGGSGVKGAMETVTENIKPDVTTSGTGFFENIGDSLSNISESIGESLHNFGEGLGDTFSNFTENFGENIGDMLENIGDSVGDIVDDLV